MDAGRQGRWPVERQSMRLAAPSSTGAYRPAFPTPRLPVRRSRHAPGAHPPSQERVDPGAAQGSRVAQAIESNQCAHPMDINRPRPYAVVQVAKALASRVGHLRRRKGRPRWRAAFVDPLVVNGKAIRKSENHQASGFPENERRRFTEQASVLTGETGSL